MAITATALNAEYGAYYVDGGQNAARLRQKLYYGAETDAFFNVVNTDNTLWEMANAVNTRTLQPFQERWSPTGDVTFTPSPIRLRNLKVDVEFYPDAIEDNWLGFLASNNLDRKEWPFVRWYIEYFLLKQHNEDWELNEVYDGVYAAPGTPGTAGAAGTAVTGIRKIINDAVTATEIPAANVINTGAFSATPETFVGQLEAFVASVNARYRNRAPMKLALGNDFQMRYMQGIRDKYNMNYQQIAAGERIRVVDAPNVELYFLPSIGEREKIVLTTEDNALMPVKNLVNVGRFIITDNTDRLVKVRTDYWKGIGFVDMKKVWTNDRDTAAS